LEAAVLVTFNTQLRGSTEIGLVMELYEILKELKKKPKK